MNLHIMIRKYVRLKGKKIILSPNLVGYLDDEQAFSDIESRPYKTLLRNIIKEGYAQKLLDIGSYTSDVSDLASQYVNKYMMQEQSVLYVLDCIAYGLGWIKHDPTMQTATQQESIQPKQNRTASSGTKKSKKNLKGITFTFPMKGFITVFTLLFQGIRNVFTLLFQGIRNVFILFLQGFWYMVTSCKGSIMEDLRWLNDKDVKENLCGSCLMVSCILIISSIIAFIIGWYCDTGHAAAWTWVFGESIVIGLCSLIYMESR